MAIDLSTRLTETIEREVPELQALTKEQSALPRGPGKWSAKEELGHLIDSATNNHMRFVGGALAAEFRGLTFAQDDWVGLHGYSAMQWQTVVDFWLSYNRFLAGLIDRIPGPRLQTECFIGTNPPVSLRFLIEDYILHMHHHIDQLLRRRVITQYPGATT